MSLETEKILDVIRDSYKKLDIVIEKYNSAVQQNTDLLEQINSLQFEIASLNDKNIKTENQKELLLKEYHESEDKNSITSKMLKDCEERIQELEKNNHNLTNELKLKGDDLETTHSKYDIKTTNLFNIIQEKDEIIKEKDEIIWEKDEIIKERDEFIKVKDETIKERELSESIVKNKNEKEINELLNKVKEMEKTILDLNDKKSYVESFNNANELLKSDIKLKIDQTIGKINSLIS
jgi:uncharacterized protein (DUF3084 family)